MKLLFIGILYAAVRGIYQGIIMHQPNPREHWLFPLYHRVMILDAVIAALFGIYLDRTIGVVPDMIHYPFLIGLFFLGWETFELCYSWTRYSLLIPERENVFGTGRIMTGLHLQLLHVARFVIAGILLGGVL